MIVIGVILVIANALENQECLCGTTVIDQLQNCSCYPVLGFYFPTITGSILIVLGLWFAISSVRKPREAGLYHRVNAMSRVLIVLILAVLLVSLIGVAFYSIHLNQANSSHRRILSGSWNYVGNTTQYFNDICPDSGLPINCEGMGNPPATIQEWTNGTLTTYVGHITLNNSTYSVVIVNNSTFCVNPRTGDEPYCVSSFLKSTYVFYQLEFVQESNCQYGSWLVPWGVVLNGQTIMVQPSNATLPLNYTSAHLTGDSNYSTISFSVPNGSYNYTILPNNFYGARQSGIATINGSNVRVQISAFITAMGCSSNTTCTAPGQPMGMFLRIISDQSSTPVAGVNVTAKHAFPIPDCAGGSSSATRSAEYSLVTNGSEWYSLDTFNGGNYSIAASYSGQTYNFTARLGYSTFTCATLYLPSGKTNVTVSPSDCQL